MCIIYAYTTKLCGACIIIIIPVCGLSGGSGTFVYVCTCA